MEVGPNEEATLRLRVTRRPKDPTYEPFKPYFIYYKSLEIRENTVDPAYVTEFVVWLDGASFGQTVTVASVVAGGSGVPGPVPFYPFIDK